MSYWGAKHQILDCSLYISVGVEPFDDKYDFLAEERLCRFWATMTAATAMPPTAMTQSAMPAMAPALSPPLYAAHEESG